MRLLVIPTLLTSVVLLGCVFPTHAAEPLELHEWGTFTSLQDEVGRTVSGINIDEELLPAFVHDLHPVNMGRDGAFATGLIKSRAYCDPTVTMRLETPVVYVHLPAGQVSATFDLSVGFRGGILSQFYPLAEATVDGLPVSWVQDELRVGRSATAKVFLEKWSPPELANSTVSTLTWRGVVAGGRGKAPFTDSPVWLAPRAVEAANLTVGDEHERYLFYRGLGHQDAPLVAKRSADGGTLSVSTRSGDIRFDTIPALWFADLRPNGTAAFRAMPATAQDPQPAAALAACTFPATFTEADYSSQRLALLRSELQAALMREGLFADEALALLTTWEASYFKTVGQRLFFLVPARWTDHVLPLMVSVPARVRRAMMGRIELVSPAQRQALKRIATGPVSDRSWFSRFIDERIHTQVGGHTVYRPGGEELSRRVFVANERGLLDELKLTPPADYLAYQSLGRFRDALLWDAQRREPDAELALFIRTYLLAWVARGWQAEVLELKPVAAIDAP